MIFDKIKAIFKKEKNINAAENAIKENSIKQGETVMPPQGNDSLDANDKEAYSDMNINVGDVNSMFKNIGVDENNNGNLQNTDTSSSVDLDKEIEDLMLQDEDTQLKEIDYEYINDVSVYDTLRKDKEEALQDSNQENNTDEEKTDEKSKMDKTYLFMFAIIGVLIVAIISTAVIIFTTILSNSSKSYASSSKKGTTTIQQPKYKANDANFIYVSQKAFLDEEELKLSKVLVDSVSTLFYFENNIDTQKYDIFLTDDKGTFYAIDLSFTSMNNNSDKNNSTVLSFEPISANARSIKLSICNSKTGEKADFQFQLSNRIQATPVKYVYDKSVTDQKTNVKVNIENAIFSSAGSRLDYSISSPGGNFSIYQVKNSKSSGVSMKEEGSEIAPFRKRPLITSFDENNIILGRMDFQAVKDLNSEVDFTFKDLYKRYNINRDIPVNQIGLGNPGADVYTVDFENYKLVLEGFAGINDKYVLVFHTEDKNIPINEPDSIENRLESRIDAQLVVSSESGMEVILEGSCMSGPIGTDMVFMLNDTQRSFISNMKGINMFIRLNAILLKTGDLNISINLSTIEENKPDIRQEAEKAVSKIFEDRLAYKSGEKSIESIRGFSDDMKNDPSTFYGYEPESLSESYYSAQIISSALRDNKLYAVVQEVWKAKDSLNQPKHIYKTHKAVAEMGQYTWSIIQDDVIK